MDRHQWMPAAGPAACSAAGGAVMVEVDNDSGYGVRSRPLADRSRARRHGPGGVAKMATMATMATMAGGLTTLLALVGGCNHHSLQSYHPTIPGPLCLQLIVLSYCVRSATLGPPAPTPPG